MTTFKIGHATAGVSVLHAVPKHSVGVSIAVEIHIVRRKAVLSERIVETYRDTNSVVDIPAYTE